MIIQIIFLYFIFYIQCSNKKKILIKNESIKSK